MLKCYKCLLEKPDDEFPRNRRAASRRGRFHWCRECNNQHYRENRERHKKSVQDRRAMVRYGITRSEYERLIAQGCSVCGPDARGRIVLDHCHVTNAVRAPLCDGCNIALGAAQDDPARLRSLADYLEQHA